MLIDLIKKRRSYYNINKELRDLEKENVIDYRVKITKQIILISTLFRLFFYKKATNIWKFIIYLSK